MNDENKTLEQIKQEMRNNFDYRHAEVAYEWALAYKTLCEAEAIEGQEMRDGVDFDQSVNLRFRTGLWDNPMAQLSKCYVDGCTITSLHCHDLPMIDESESLGVDNKTAIGAQMESVCE